MFENQEKRENMEIKDILQKFYLKHRLDIEFTAC